MADDPTPSRDQFRAQRRQRRSALRRRVLGIPLILLGIGMMVAGTWVWLDDDSGTPDPTVAGTSQEQVTTTSGVEVTTTVAEVGLIPPATATNPANTDG